MKKNTSKIKLNDSLQKIYNVENLNTTCDGRCECCKVAMPSMNYSEFINLITTIWQKSTTDEKIDLICTSIEYWFKHDFEKWGIQTLVKPCMLLDKDTGRCKWYEKRPLSCRMYGLWPKEEYERRVDKFEKVYKKHGLTRKDLPLNTQCDRVKRVDDSIPLTTERINELFKMIDNVDAAFGEFSPLQVNQKENYRTFHDWLLLKIFGPDWLSMLTSFVMAATREQMQEQIDEIKKAVREKFSKDMPQIME